MDQQISITIPWFLQPVVFYMDIVWSYCIVVYDTIIVWWSTTIDTITTLQTYSTTTNVIIPFITIVLFFWPLFISIGMALFYTWAWIFWITTSMIVGTVQIIYASYQFFMISIDLLGLSMLKVYNMTRHTILYYCEAIITSSTISKLKRISSYDTLSTKAQLARRSLSGLSSSNSTTITKQEYYHSVKKNRRRIWKDVVEKANCYENFLKIRIEPKDLTFVIRDIESKDESLSNLSSSSLLQSRFTTNNNNKNNNNINIFKRDTALPPLKSNNNTINEFNTTSSNSNQSSSTVTNRIMRRVQSFTTTTSTTATTPISSNRHQPNTFKNDRKSTISPRRTLSFSSGDNSTIDKHIQQQQQQQQQQITGTSASASASASTSIVEELQIDPIIIYELGDKIATLLTSTMIRLHDARINAMQAAENMMNSRNMCNNSSTGSTTTTTHTNTIIVPTIPTTTTTTTTTSTTTTIVLQQQYQHDKEIYSKALSTLQYLLSAVVKRNHLTLEDIVIENARSVADTGRYGLSNQSRHIVRAYYEEVQKSLDYTADAPLLAEPNNNNTIITATTATTNNNNMYNNNTIQSNHYSDDSSDNSPTDTTVQQTPPLVHFPTTVPIESSLKGYDKSPSMRKKGSNNNSYNNLANAAAYYGNASVSSRYNNNNNTNNSTCKMKQQTELNDRITLIRKMKHNMGRTALMFSGGGAQAMYHLGVIRALIESRLYDDISVISGTSGGSIVAAMCAIKTADELYNTVCVNTVSTDFGNNGQMKELNIRWFPRMIDMITYWMKHRLVVDSVEFGRTCEFYYNTTTFEEAFQRTGKHVCITVSASRASGNTAQRLLLNHISTPNVTIASAVRASCALPGVMKPAKLMVKNSDGILEPFEVDGVEWIDGSVQADLPFQRIATLFAVTSFIVSQTNFHIVPFINKTNHQGHSTLYWRLFQTLEWDIRNRALKLSRLGLFPKIFGQDISNVFKQKYHGNLTIVPRFTAMQTIGMKILSNPTVKDMDGYLKYSQIAVWPYLNAIRDMIRLEKSLDDCLSRLESRMHSVAGRDVDLFANSYNDDVESIASSYVASSSLGGAFNANSTIMMGSSHSGRMNMHYDYHHQNSIGSIRSVRISGLTSVSNDFCSTGNNALYNTISEVATNNNNNNNKTIINHNNIEASKRGGTDQLQERLSSLENENQQLRLQLEQLKLTMISPSIVVTENTEEKKEAENM